MCSSKPSARRSLARLRATRIISVRSPRATQFSLRTRAPPRRLSSYPDGARINQMPGSRTMRTVGVFIIAIFLACPIFATNESREQKRLEACGQVFKEILDIPDGIPKDLLNKAECVIVIPSVLKFAIGIGGDFGRGAIACRRGEHRFPAGRSGHGLRPLGHESQRGELNLEQQGEAWRRCLCSGGAQGTC